MDWLRTIQRHLKNEPVVACPPSNLYRVQKLVRRNKLAFAAGAGIAATLVLGLCVATWGLVREREARNRAVANEKKAHASEQQAQTETAKSQQVAQFLKDMLGGAGPEVAKGRDATILLEILDQTTRRLRTELKNQPAVKTDLLETIQNVYEDLGQYDRSEALAREVLAIKEKSLGKDHPFVATALNNLALTLSGQGKEAEAEELLRRALAIRSEKDDPDGPPMVLGNLAAVLRTQGKLSEAKLRASESLMLRKKILRDDDPKVASSLRILGDIEYEQGDFIPPQASSPSAKLRLLSMAHSPRVGAFVAAPMAVRPGPRSSRFNSSAAFTPLPKPSAPMAWATFMSSEAAA